MVNPQLKVTNDYKYLSGKNDGSVNGVHYFNCRPKHGIFVRVDKLIQDRRGRAMRAYKAEQSAALGSKSSRGMNKTMI